LRLDTWAGYIAFIWATTQVLWLTKYFDEIGLPALLPIIIHADNDSSILNSKNHRHTKHIDIKHHFVKEHAKLGQVLFKYILSSDNTTDMFTKPLTSDALQKFILHLGITANIQSMPVQRV